MADTSVRRGDDLEHQTDQAMNQMPDFIKAFSEFATSLPSHLVLLAIASIFAAAVLRGFTGFGFALAAVPLLGMFLPPKDVVPIAIVLQLLGSLLDIRSSTTSCHWPSLRWLMIGAALGLPLGVAVMVTIPAPAARLVISAITIFAVIILSRGFALPAVPGRGATSAVGFVAGVFNGLAAMPGPPVVAYYMSIPVTREGTRSSLMVFFMMTSVVATIAALSVGLVTMEVIVLSVIGLPAMWIGTKLGEIGFKYGSPEMHRRVSIVTLGLLSLLSAAKGLEELLK